MRNLLAAALLVLLAAAASAQPGDLQVNTHGEGYQVNPAVAMDRRGNTVVVWRGDGPAGLGVYGRLFDRDGRPRGSQFLVAVSITQETGHFSSVAMDDSGFVVVWHDRNQSGSLVLGRDFRSDGTPRGRAYRLDGQGAARIALGADGRFLLTGVDEGGLYTRLYQRSGTPASERKPLLDNIVWGYVASRGAQGYVVTWQDGTIIRGRFVSPDGGLAGGSFTVVESPELGGLMNVTAAPDGRFVVTWARDLGDGVYDLLGRLYGPEGEPVTGTLELKSGAIGSDGLILAAMDAEGKFLLAWTEYDSVEEKDWGNVYGRRFDASGRPVGGAFRLNAHVTGTQNIAAVAAGPADRFFAAWTSWPFSFDEPQDGDGPGVFGRALAWARPGSDPCTFIRSGFSCDAAHDGGKAEVDLPFPVIQGDRPLLGDLDGNGKDDPCVFRTGNRFVCDQDHDGTPDLDVSYGRPGDVPLLGDLDGEGRDDACVRQGTRLLCDTAHDGGTAEMVVTFGEAADVPLLGDLDGDGDDDPCVRRGAVFLCDTVHDGLGAEVSIPFGKAGDVPLLGDLNGDGRDDPCVLRTGRLLCDTAHDGGKAELSLRFTLPGTPLLGDVDGL